MNITEYIFGIVKYMYMLYSLVLQGRGISVVSN